MNNIDIDKSIEDIMNHDIYLSLEPKLHTTKINSYQSMLFHLISASRNCLKEEILKPNTLVLGYEGEILYNDRLHIKEVIENKERKSHTCNFTLDLVADPKYPALLHYCIQEKVNPEKAYFHWLNVSKTLDTYDFEDISLVVNLIVNQHQLSAKHDTINIELIKHLINFDTGDWLIQKI